MTKTGLGATVSSCLLWSASLCVPCPAGALKSDTAHLADNLNRLQKLEAHLLSPAEDELIRDEYMAWIDSRMGSVNTLTQMNDELGAAGLLSRGPETVDEMFSKTYTGFLEKVEPVPIRPAGDLLAVRFGVYTGGNCNLDETVLLYERRSLRRIARINAEQSFTYGYRFRALAAGKEDPRQSRVIASAWVLSNCTSNWNGNLFRIDVAHGRSLDNVLDRGVEAFGGKSVEIRIENGTVTFDYTTRIGDTDGSLRGGVARYRIQDGHAVREAPIAASVRGFISEWLDLDDSEAARWSTPEAAARHHKLAARFNKDLFTWEHTADCAGSPPMEEIAIQWGEPKQGTVFLVGGRSVAEMRMLSVSDGPSPSCREIDSGPASVTAGSEP